MIKLTIRGIPVEVATPEEAWELIRLSETASGSVPTRAARVVGKVTVIREAIGSREALRWTVDLLQAIKAGGNLGVESDKILPVLNVTSAKGIGGRMAIINKLLVENGLVLRDVYSNKKTPNGRIWKARKGIDNAIELLERKLGAAH